ncbi:hypothetical protein cypCar_00023544 [Cyprinus carpio]|nr:hypothetical protein cypCar_00023544 [Cyprinus carpio]
MNCLYRLQMLLKTMKRTEYRPEYERLHRELAEAQSQNQEEQLERLRKDMGAVPMETAVPGTDALDLGGPSDLIFTCGNPDKAEEDIDSDTDDIDHTGEDTSNSP